MARSEQAQRRPEDRQFQERRSARDFDRRYESWIGRTRLTANRVSSRPAPMKRVNDAIDLRILLELLGPLATQRRARREIDQDPDLARLFAYAATLLSRRASNTVT